jgi:hypothetical protein
LVSYVVFHGLHHVLWRAATAHGDHERRSGEHGADWPNWYADYVIREQTGQKLPE